MRALLLSCALLVPACASSTATSPDGEAPTPPPPVVVGGAWEAPRVIADAGERPLVSCPSYHTTFPCRPLFGQSWPRLALAPSGLGLALWNRWDGSDFRLTASRFADGGWAAPVDLALAVRGTPREWFFDQYALAGDGAGNGLAVWLAGDALQASRFTSGGWTAPEPIGEGWEAAPALHAAAGGLVVWKERLSTLLWSRREESGWTRPAVLVDAPNVQPFIDQHRLAMAADGSALAAWTLVNQVVGTVGLPPEYDEVWTSRYTPGRGWSGAQRIARFEGGHVFKLNVAAHGAGGVVSYLLVQPRRGGPDDWEIWAQDSSRPPGGSDSWSGPRRIGGTEPGVERADLPSLATNTRGNAVLAWAAAADTSGRYSVWAARFTAAARSWDPPALIADAAGYLDTLPSSADLRAALSEAGNAVVVWRHDDTSARLSELWASHFVPGTGWGAPQRLRDAADTAVNSGFSAPETTMDANGNAVVVWAQPDGDRVQIWSARLVAQSR